MKSKAILIVIFSLFLVATVTGLAQARDRHPRPPYGPGWYPGECCRGPAYGWWGPGPGYGYGYGYGWRGYGPDRSAFGDSLSKGEAKKLVQWIIRYNPNLQVGDVMEVKKGYEVTIVTRKGKDLVDTLFVEKDTAYVYPVYKSVEE